LRDRFYIAIEGGIGVGKTTLARRIKDRFGTELLQEVFEENPFLSDFYSDRARHAFQTQIFFLLSRYHQQNRVIHKILSQRALVSDYSFAKDRLFAHLNLSGNELEMYERVHTILAHNIPLPDLVVFLRADTDILMQRIASRDRSYERNMSRQYIDDLRLAYERFFAEYTECPVLSIDTNHIDFVANPDDLNAIASEIRIAIEERAYQPQLPTMESPSDAGRPSLPDIDIDAWRVAAQQPGQLPAGADERVDDLYFQYLSLTEDIGQIGARIAHTWASERDYESQVGNRIEASERALGENLPELRDSLLRGLRRLTDMARLVNGRMNGLPPAEPRP
jgi:deoxyguanosine kinase